MYEKFNLQLIKNVRKYDEVLLRIPAFEKTVSQVLRDIKVVRRYVPLIENFFFVLCLYNRLYSTGNLCQKY